MPQYSNRLAWTKNIPMEKPCHLWNAQTQLLCPLTLRYMAQLSAAKENAWETSSHTATINSSQTLIAQINRETEIIDRNG